MEASRHSDAWKCDFECINPLMRAIGNAHGHTLHVLRVMAQSIWTDWALLTLSYRLGMTLRVFW